MPDDNVEKIEPLRAHENCLLASIEALAGDCPESLRPYIIGNQANFDHVGGMIALTISAQGKVPVLFELRQEAHLSEEFQNLLREHGDVFRGILFQTSDILSPLESHGSRVELHVVAVMPSSEKGMVDMVDTLASASPRTVSIGDMDIIHPELPPESVIGFGVYSYPQDDPRIAHDEEIQAMWRNTQAQLEKLQNPTHTE